MGAEIMQYEIGGRRRCCFCCGGAERDGRELMWLSVLRLYNLVLSRKDVFIGVVFVQCEAGGGR